MTAIPSGSIVERAHALAPLLAQYASQGDEQARLAPTVVTAMRDAGLFGLFAPREVGGEEATLREGFEAVVAVAAVDPSDAWHMVNSQAGTRAATLVDPSWWPLIFHAPLPPSGLCTSFGGELHPSPSGYTLNGTWPLMTGVLDAEWAVLNVRVVDEDRRRRRAVLVHTAPLTVTETWSRAVAKRGTGSHQVTATDVEVPRDLVVDMAGPSRIDRTLFRCSFPLWGATINAGVAVGILRSAVDATAALLHGKVSTIFGTKAVESTALLKMMAAPPPRSLISKAASWRSSTPSGSTPNAATKRPWP